MFVLAIDIGGTKCAAAIVDREGNIISRDRIWTTGDDLYGRVVAMARGLLSGAPASVRQATTLCGVGCGGPMTFRGREVSPLNIPAWRSLPLPDLLRRDLGLDAYVDNDAKALALGEGWRGAARGERNYLAMVVSTGVGAGLVVDGRLLDGAAGNAGHLGHVIVEPEGRPCACGAVGCLEAHASGLSIAAITGRPAAEADDATRRRVGTLVGRAVASAVGLLDIGLALVGGSVALGFGELFFAAANEELAARCRLEFGRGARIGPVGLGVDGPLVGAAAVALAQSGAFGATGLSLP